tara:strand:+ start:409 stop:534 length:126 start_codon:yes stop_codon:yes gene_type:complete
MQSKKASDKRANGIRKYYWTRDGRNKYLATPQKRNFSNFLK